MFYTIRIGIVTESYCDVTIDADDVSQAGAMVTALAKLSPTFRGWLQDHMVTQGTQYEPLECGNVGRKVPTFTDDYLERLINEALTNYIRKAR